MQHKSKSNKGSTNNWVLKGPTVYDALPSMQEDVTKQWDSEFGKPAKKRNR